MKINASRKRRRRKLSFGILLVLSPTWVHAAICPPQYQETTVFPAFIQATAGIQKAIMAVDAALSTQLAANSLRLTSAIAVLIKQKALAANQIADTSRTVSQQLATGLKTLATFERVEKARFDYGGEFGQGFSPCLVYATRQAIANRDADMASARRERVMSEVIAAPGRYVDPIEGQRELVKANKAFCTQDHVDSGLCKTVGTLPGASLTVVTLFEPAMEGEKLYDAKVAFVNNMVGLPDGPVPAAAGLTPATAAYSLAKSRKDALVSPAIASLKEIQLDHSGVTGTETGKDIPLAVHFRNEVKRYAGHSTDNDAWTRVISAQNERGVLVELLKIKALDLAIQEKQYRQYERMEAQLAALVAIEVQLSGLQNKTADAAQGAATQNVKNAIK